MRKKMGMWENLKKKLLYCFMARGPDGLSNRLNYGEAKLWAKAAPPLRRTIGFQHGGSL